MTKSRQWATLTAVVCLAVLAAGWFLVIKPQRSHAAELRTSKQTVDTQSAQLETQVAQLRQQQKDLPAQQKLLSQIATKIPDNPALPALIRQLSAAADGAGVNLMSMAPGAPALPQAAALGSRTSSAAALATIPLSIQVQGSYFNVEQFFSAVESLSRAMLVSGFTMQPLATSAATANGAPTVAPGTLAASITAEVFESPSAVAASAPTTSTSATTATGH